MPASLTRRKALAHALALGGGMALPSVHAAEARGRVLQATRQLPALARQLQREARRDKSSRISAINESLGTFRAENKFAIAARRQQTPDSPLRVGGLA